MSSDESPTTIGSRSPGAQPNAQPPARVIGGYELIEKIGQGGMGSVFKARQVSLDRVVALKVLPPSIAQDEMFIKRFVREARACAKLSHPNIVLGIDVGQDEATKLWYFAMEFVDGPSLGRVLQRRNVLPEQEALALARDVAKALECAQQNGFVHRDVKPDNILLSSSGTAKLADLGLARKTNEDASLTQSGMAMGSPYYISPEQVRGEINQLDIRTDLYALGGTLFHLVTGHPPFNGETGAVIMAKHLTDVPPLAHRVNPEVSEATSRMIQRLLQKEKEKRFQTPRELTDHIEKILAGTLTASQRPRTTGPRDAVRTTGPRQATRAREPAAPAGAADARKPGGLYVGIAAAGLVAIGLVLYLTLGGSDTRRAENRTAPPASPAPPPIPPAPSPASNEQQRTRLSAMLTAAQEFEQNNPTDFQTAKTKYDELLALARSTPGQAAFVTKAEEASNRILQRWQDSADAAWQTREQKIAPLLEAGDYDAAIRLCEEPQPGLDDLLKTKTGERAAAVRKAAEARFAPSLTEAEAASTSAEPQKGLDALAKVEHLKFAPLNATVEGLKKRLQDELANAAELGKKQVRLAAEKRLNEHLQRFDTALLEKDDLAVARAAATAARGDAALKPHCEEQAEALGGIVKAFEDLQRQKAEALSLLVGTELIFGKDNGVVKKVEGDAITVTLALEGPGGKATAQKTLRVSDLTVEQRAAIFRNVKPSDSPAGKLAAALGKLQKGGSDPAAAEELLNAVPEHLLTPHYIELARTKRLGAAEVAAEKAWGTLQNQLAALKTAVKSAASREEAKSCLASIQQFEGIHGATKFAVSVSVELLAAKARLSALTADVVKTGLRLWFRADAGVIKDAEGRVSKWADQSGQDGSHAIQEKPALQPIATTLAGRPVIRFQGNGQCLTASCDMNGLKGATIFVVTAPGRNQDVSQSHPYNNENAAIWWGEVGGWGNIVLTTQMNKVGFRFGSGQGDNRPSYVRPKPLAVGELSITTTLHDGANRTDHLFINGVNVLSVGGRLEKTAANARACFLGRGEYDSYFCGSIAEVLVYTEALSAQDRTTVETYLRDKYLDAEQKSIPGSRN